MVVYASLAPPELCSHGEIIHYCSSLCAGELICYKTCSSRARFALPLKVGDFLIILLETSLKTLKYYSLLQS